jgi:hypothetical protein
MGLLRLTYFSDYAEQNGFAWQPADVLVYPSYAMLQIFLVFETVFGLRNGLVSCF